MIDKKELARIFSWLEFDFADDVGILNHCLLVGGVANFLAVKLKAVGENIDPDLVHLVSVLHDIGKVNDGPQDRFHVTIGSKILRAAGRHDLAKSVLNHQPYSFTEEEKREYGMSGNDLEDWPTKLVCLADLLVGGEIAQSWEARITDITTRYPELDKDLMLSTARKIYDEVVDSIGPIQIPFSIYPDYCPD